MTPSDPDTTSLSSVQQLANEKQQHQVDFTFYPSPDAVTALQNLICVSMLYLRRVFSEKVVRTKKQWEQNNNEKEKGGGKGIDKGSKQARQITHLLVVKNIHTNQITSVLPTIYDNNNNNKQHNHAFGSLFSFFLFF